MRRTIPGVVILLCALSAAGSEPALTVVLENGARVRGHAAEIADGGLVLYLREHGGFSERRWPLGQVVELTFEAEDADAVAREGGVEQVLASLRTAASWRLPLAEVLSAADVALCSAYAEALLNAGQAAEAAAVARRLHRSGKRDGRAADVLLEALLRSGHPDVVMEARAWCECRDPADGVALGWWVLAETHLSAGEAREALWVALQPCVFARGEVLPGVSRHLAMSHAVAIEACRRLGSSQEALQILAQLRERRLAWPTGEHTEALAWVEAVEAAAGKPPAEESPLESTVLAPSERGVRLPSRLVLRPSGSNPSLQP